MLFRLPVVFESQHLKQVKSDPNIQGAEFLLIQKKIFSEWFDYKTNPDKPGDIRWGSQYLPLQLKNFLGLKSFNKNNIEIEILANEVHHVQVPTVNTVIARFKMLKERMLVKDPAFKIIGFYETTGHANSDQYYLERFSQESLLPFSNNGHLFEHDLNFHVYSSLVIPSHMTAALQTRVTLVLNFKKFLEDRSVKLDSARGVLKVLEKTVLPELVQRVDISTGNMFQAVVRLEKESLSKIMTEVDDILDLAFMGQTSPQMYLLHLLNRPELGELLLPHLREFLDQLPQKYKNEDLTKAFVENPAELYNEARTHLKVLNSIAD